MGLDNRGCAFPGWRQALALGTYTTSALVPVHAGPGCDFKHLGDIMEGEDVRVVAQDSGHEWVRVDFMEHPNSWVQWQSKLGQPVLRAHKSTTQMKAARRQGKARARVPGTDVGTSTRTSTGDGNSNGNVATESSYGLASRTRGTGAHPDDSARQVDDTCHGVAAAADGGGRSTFQTRDYAIAAKQYGKARRFQNLHVPLGMPVHCADDNLYNLPSTSDGKGTVQYATAQQGMAVHGMASSGSPGKGPVQYDTAQQGAAVHWPHGEQRATFVQDGFVLPRAPEQGYVNDDVVARALANDPNAAGSVFDDPAHEGGGADHYIVPGRVAVVVVGSGGTTSANRPCDQATGSISYGRATQRGSGAATYSTAADSGNYELAGGGNYELAGGGNYDLAQAGGQNVSTSRV